MVKGIGTERKHQFNKKEHRPATSKPDSEDSENLNPEGNFC